MCDQRVDGIITGQENPVADIAVLYRSRDKYKLIGIVVFKCNQHTLVLSLIIVKCGVCYTHVLFSYLLFYKMYSRGK